MVTKKDLRYTVAIATYIRSLALHCIVMHDATTQVYAEVPTDCFNRILDCSITLSMDLFDLMQWHRAQQTFGKDCMHGPCHCDAHDFH